MMGGCPSAPVVAVTKPALSEAVVAPVAQAGWSEVDSLDVTGRGAGGFGSTGTQ